MTNEKKNLYAFIVGIDEYDRAPLSGCVKDAKAIEKFLNSDIITTNFNPIVATLHNKEATKTAITKGFSEHLGQAGPNDVAFFYFSGHGAQENADPDLWHEEGDRKLEGIVCVDSLNTNLLLADKELRYLIGQVAAKKPHLVTLFDCCHSGENTRGFEVLESENKKQLVHSRMSVAFPERRWTDFCFHDKISPDALKSQSLNEVLPQGDHVHIAACRSDQSAYETNIPGWGRGGVFTYTLIQVLNRSNAAVSYYDLKSRIMHYVKNQFNQTPNIYVKGEDKRDFYRIFLGSEMGSQPLYGNVVYDSKIGEWIMDMGAIHGISKQAGTVQIVNDDQKITANIKKVDSASTLLDMPPSLQKDKNAAFKAFVHPFKSAPIGVYIDDDSYESDARDLLVKKIEEAGTNVNLVDDERQADYTVQLDKWYYTITLPNDPYRPLVMPVEQDEDDAVDTVFGYLYHISQWEFVRQLHNSDQSSQLDAGAVNVEFFKSENDQLLPLRNDEVDIILYRTDETVSIKTKITNTSGQNLYVAALYLGVNFEIDPESIEGKVQFLAPNDFVYLKYDNNINIPYILDDCKRLFNWEKSTSYLQLIISTHQFEVANFYQPGLPDPSELVESEATRGRAKGRKSTQQNADAERWTTRLLACHILNPEFNKIREADLTKYLETDAAPFMSGLYLEKDSGFSNELNLKEGITAIDQNGTAKGGFLFKTKLKMANWVSRKVRKKRYKKMLKKNPDAIRIVSEGDSWFQYPHPKVKDIIDHLYNHYAICSLGAAGDELINYLRSNEFLETIDQEKPAYFLISGGGNDILGPEFEHFLSDDIQEDWEFKTHDDLRRFMGDSLFAKLQQLGDAYTIIFKEMQERHPDLHVLVHGYDYVIPLDSDKEGWLGRYMKAKGMKRQEDRRMLIKHLLIEFNNVVAARTEDFPNAHYVNCRERVTDDCWYDEIHPDSRGFADVAGAFLAKLEELEGAGAG